MTNHPDDPRGTSSEPELPVDVRDTRDPPAPARLSRQVALLLGAIACFVLVGGLMVFLIRDTDDTSDTEEPATPQIAASPEATNAVASPAATATSAETLAAVTATATATEPPAEETGEQILVVSSGLRSPEDGHEQLLLVDPADGSVRHLTDQPGRHTHPSLSPDGTQVVFVGDRDGTTELYVLTIADGTIQRLTNNDQLESAPAWSPAGSRIAFDCYPELASGLGDVRICLIDPDGANLVTVTEDDLHGHNPVWSPDGRQFAFIGHSGGNEDIYIANADGSGARKLLPDGVANGSFPAWSPDGSQITYTSYRTEGTAGLSIVNADGTGDHLLIDPPYGAWSSWSPDGTMIAVSAWVEGNRYSLSVVNADGTGLRELADDLGYSPPPTWSPDGDEIAVVNGATLEIFAADGSARRTLTTNVSSAWPITWQVTDPPPVLAAPTPTVTGSPVAELPTLDEIYIGLQATLGQPDKIARVNVTTTGPKDSMNQNGTMEFWIDATNDRARAELSGDVAILETEVTFETTSLTIQGIRYTLHRQPESRLDTGNDRTCYGVRAAVTTLLDCPGGPTENSTTTVESGEWQGQPVLVLVTIGTSWGSDEQFTFTDRTYLDPETFLPLAQRVEGTHSYGKVDTTSVYQHEFIDATTLPADHFDPVALAIERLDSTAQSTPLYWLGARVQPVTDLPALVLMGGGVPDVPDAGYDTSLSYRMEEPRIALSNTIQPEVVLFTWSRAEWDEGLGNTLRGFWADDECGQASEIEVAGGQATMFLGYLDTTVPRHGWVDPSLPTPDPSASCTQAPYERFEAVVAFEDTVVFLYLPPESAYRTPEALEAIVRAVQRR